jgi:hypothetical protein
LGFIHKFKCAAFAEVEQAFNLTAAKSETILNNLQKENLIKIIPVGNSCFITEKDDIKKAPQLLTTQVFADIRADCLHRSDYDLSQQSVPV